MTASTWEEPDDRTREQDELTASGRHLSSDPDPLPGTDVAPDAPAGLGEPTEDPDPPVE